MKPYSIFLPNFDTTSGGIRVMWGLYGHLLARGQIVHPNTQYAGDFIGIYPEIVNGNPLGASTVVRYILNKPGVMGGQDQFGNFTGGPTTFDRADRLYYFSKLFGQAQDLSHYMFLPILDTRLFKDQYKKRTKIAYFIGKGTDTGVHPAGSILIDRSFAQDQQALADLLNECEVLYCYDPVTAMTEISRLCGCRVVMINPVYSKDEFRNYEPGMNGISWGTDEKVPLNTKGFASHYITMRMHFGKKLDSFIKETQQ